MRMLIIAVLAVSSALIGQEAKIMIVEKSDSQRLAKAYREYKDALKNWEAVKADVAKSYTMDGKAVIAGWEKVQFSADFRAIVPENSQYAGQRQCYYSWLPSSGSVLATGTTGTTWAVPASGTISSSATTVNSGGLSLSGSQSVVPEGAIRDGDLHINVDGVVPDLKVKERRAGSITIKGNADNPGYISAESGDLKISTMPDGMLKIEGGKKQ